MFGLRKDGKVIKYNDPIEKMIPHIMSERSDSHNWCEVDARCEFLDAYIDDAYARTGVTFNYLTIVVAALARVYAMRQKLNRFVMNGRIYQRNKLNVSITIKASLKDESPDLTLKLRFSGRENIFEVKEIIDGAINKILKEQLANKTTETVSKFTWVPNGILKFAVWFIKFLDKHGMLPNSLLEVSPFHTSFYITNLKSIKGEWIYHHIYNFGTTGLFISMGKEKQEPVVDDGELKIGKVMRMGITMDERYCDGFYFIKSLKCCREFLIEPKLLEETLDIEPIESAKERKKRLKCIDKQKV